MLSRLFSDSFVEQVPTPESVVSDLVRWVLAIQTHIEMQGEPQPDSTFVLTCRTQMVDWTSCKSWCQALVSALEANMVDLPAMVRLIDNVVPRRTGFMPDLVTLVWNAVPLEFDIRAFSKWHEWIELGLRSEALLAKPNWDGAVIQYATHHEFACDNAIASLWNVRGTWLSRGQQEQASRLLNQWLPLYVPGPLLLKVAVMALSSSYPDSSVVGLVKDSLLHHHVDWMRQVQQAFEVCRVMYDDAPDTKGALLDAYCSHIQACLNATTSPQACYHYERLV